MRKRPIIAITIGDINGIGPEVIVKALSKSAIRKACRPVIVGPTSVVEQQLKFVNQDLQLIEVSDLRERELSENEIEVLDAGTKEYLPSDLGEITTTGGEVAAKALEMAINMAVVGKVDAMTTAPISKAALNLAGYYYPGQTELLAEKTHTDEVVMVLLSGDFRVGLVTTHCPIASVPRLLSKEKICKKIEILNSDLQDRFKIPKPKIAVTALNPHAGEGGMFGGEETETIQPAIHAAKNIGIEVEGPFPADTLFARLQDNKFDAYLAMYHDQGLIPLKMSSFGRAVNYTAGLPIIRTSPDHGTAFDIVGKGVADSGSMVEAIKLAIAMATKTDRR
ncbi:MAG: 4-hydroxythreonine-4-phosphate dehydrogenase PdxA [bacterium]